MIKLYSGHISNKTVKLSVCVYLKKVVHEWFTGMFIQFMEKNKTSMSFTD
jgi:hypothetical protein